MAYNTDILDRLDELADSQPELLANFAAIAALLQQDHIDFNLADGGKHRQLVMPQQQKADVPTPNATDYGMFVGDETLHGRTYNNILQFQQSGVTPDQAVTGSFSTARYDSPFFEQQSMRLPSGILIKWAFEPLFELRSSTNDARMVFDWRQANNREDFTAQYWAMVTPFSIVPQWQVTIQEPIVGQSTISGNSDNPAIFTVYDISNPSLVRFLAFRRNPTAGFFPTAISAYNGGLLVLGIGV